LPRARDDETTLEGLYEANYRGLLGLATVMLHDRGMAEEAVQEAFVRLISSGRLERGDPDRLDAYLRKALINVVRSRLRRRFVARKYSPPVDGSVASAEEQAMLNEQQRAVIGALRDLAARQRECLALRYYLDLSDAQIADALGLSTSSVKTHLRRGIDSLAARLEAAP